MIHIQTILIYTTLLILMFWSADRMHDSRFKSIYSAIPILLYSIVFGLRYGVGYDYFHYIDLYQSLFDNLKLEDIFSINYEYGFSFITILFSGYKVQPYLWLMFFAFIQILLITKTFDKEENILPYIYMSFLLTGIGITEFTNIIRQGTAFCFYLYAIKCISDRKLGLYILFWVLAFSFHKSAIILLPLGLIWYFKDSIFNRPKIQFVCAIISFITVFSPYSFEKIYEVANPFILLLGYDSYTESASDTIFSRDTIGPSFIIRFLVNCLLILYSDKIKSYYNSKIFNMIYDMFFVGICLGYLFKGNLMISRILRYFLDSLFIIYAYAFVYFVKYQRKKVTHAVCTILLILSFLSSYIGLFYRSTTALYVSVFQDELYYFKDHERDVMDH